MRPRQLAVVAAVVVVAVTLAVVVLSLMMILCVHLVGFSCFMKRRNGQTDLRTDRPPYRDARTHLKIQTYRRIYGPTDLRTDLLIEMRGRI